MNSFAGSGLVAYGLKGMFAPIWANGILANRKRLYMKLTFIANILNLGDIKDVNGRDLPFAHLSWGQFSMPGFVFGWFFRRYSRIQKRDWWNGYVLDEMEEKPLNIDFRECNRLAFHKWRR